MEKSLTQQILFFAIIIIVSGTSLNPVTACPKASEYTPPANNGDKGNNGKKGQNGGGPQGNNGFGNGDQDAPGGSLENNNGRYD